MKKLYELVVVNSKYCDYLRKYDYRVSHNAGQKALRPFVGVLFEIENMKYFAPLSSPKQKHLSMKNDIDFRKLEGGRLGAVNFNNMIPIPEGEYSFVDTHSESLTYQEEKYKVLLQNQLRWLNRDGRMLKNIAYNLYEKRVNGTLSNRVQKRCCDFSLLEKKCKEWEAERNKKNPIDINKFGKIIQDMYEVAKKSDNYTWFLEPDSFEDGTYTMEDYHELIRDMELLHNRYGVLDIDTIIEISDYEPATNDCDTVATFYGAFYVLFADDPEQARQELTVREAELEYEYE